MSDTSKSFADVLAYELEAVRGRRAAVSGTGTPAAVPAEAGVEVLRRAALGDGLVGLALSGGGVRSATFCLGFLQGLSRLNLLPAVDYLSTVSGGGYVGSWLSAWIHREAGRPGADPAAATGNVEKQLDPDRKTEARADRRVGLLNPPRGPDPDVPLGELFPPPAGDPRPRPVLDDEPEPVYHLRAYSNYLAPRPGWFSGDMWTLYAIYARNTLVNLLILVPTVLVFVFLAYCVVWCFAQQDAVLGWAFAGLAAAAVVSAVSVMARGFVLLARPPTDKPPTPWQAFLTSRKGFVYFMVIPTVVAVVLTTWLITVAPADVAPAPEEQVAAPAEVVEGTWEMTLDPKRADKSGVVTVGPVTAKLRVGPPPEAAEPVPRKEKVVKLRYPWYDAVYGLLHWYGTDGDGKSRAIVAFATGFALIGVAAVFLWLIAYRFAAGSCLTRLVMGVSLLGAGAVGWVGHTAAGWELVRTAAGPAAVVALWGGYSALRLLVEPGGGWRRLGLAVGTPVVLSGVVGALVGVVEEYALAPVFAYPAAVATLGPPLILLALALAGFVEAALLSKCLTAHDREWRARLAATHALIGAGWLAFFGVVFFLPWAVRALGEGAAASLTWTAVAGWVTTTVGGLFAAKSPRTGGVEGQKPSRVLGLLAALGPVVFLVGLLGLLGFLAGQYVQMPPGGDVLPSEARLRAPVQEWQVYVGGPDRLGKWTRAAEFARPGLALLGCLGVALVLSGLTDVNVFSMHALYGNRLVRGYLGASRRKAHATDADRERGGRLRKRGTVWEWEPGIGGAPTGVGGPVRRENPVTGFDGGDDLALSRLRFKNPPPGETPYTGPYHLIGTALNLVAGEELAVQDRRASSFVLSPGFCGSDETGYAKTPEPTATDPRTNLTLGRAMTISGAAADPNMSAHVSPAVTALMTVFNVRLGWWMENPRYPAWGAWAAGSPWTGMLSSLVREFFGLTHAHGQYVHLSDGGHFDNTGVYELVRRRCRYVVQVDAAADPDDLYEDLAQLVRRVRADFGVRIEIDPTPVRRGADRLSRWHVAVGRIRYDDVDANALAGTLVYVRPTRTGDEPIDVREYADAHPDYPHRTTADQFFDNDQFEAYRMLGEHVAFEVFEDAVQVAPRWPAKAGAGADDYRRAVRSLFAEVHGRWYPPPTGIDAAFQQAGQDCAALMRQFREDEQLAGFVRDMYPELARTQLALSAADPRGVLTARTPADRGKDVELMATNQLLDVMERAWHGIRLASHYDHPINRGWMNAFRRWSSSPAFHRAWPVIRGEYGKGFVRFCERALNLPAYTALPVEFDATKHGEQVARLGEEFNREWGSRLGRVMEMRAGRAAGAADKSPAPFFVTGTGDHLSRLVKEARDASTAVPQTAYGQAWLLDLAELQQDGTTRAVPHLADRPVGLIAVVPRGLTDGVPQYEVVFWVRPAYRSLGLGRSAVEHPTAVGGRTVPLYRVLRDAIRGTHPGVKVHLWAHYPADLNTRGDRPQRGMWLNFFHDYDYCRYDRPPAVAGTELPWVSVRYEE